MPRTRPHPRKLFIILILGALTTVNPFAIDMYLAAFPQIARALNTDTTTVALSLSSYFLGLAIGQLVYGPLLDRFGRKRPIYFGLTLFVATSVGCLLVSSVHGLIALRFLQALGGCAASVGAMSMVRDFFPVKESAKIFSLLVLILSVSPLLAPTFGGFIAVWFGWQMVFVMLAIITAIIGTVMWKFLPEGHQPDPDFSLRPLPILRTYKTVLSNVQFSTYAIGSAFSFAGLFVYLAASPVIFMEIFHVSPQIYGLIFAMMSVGPIGGNQVNILMLRWFTNEGIFKTAQILQVSITIVFVIATYFGVLNLYTTFAMFFLFLSCVGFTSPNGSALALAPFTKNVGSASALIGFSQISIAGIASAGVAVFKAAPGTPPTSLPATLLMLATSLVGLGILIYGRSHIKREVHAKSTEAGITIPH